MSALVEKKKKRKNTSSLIHFTVYQEHEIVFKIFIKGDLTYDQTLKSDKMLFKMILVV